MAKNGFLKDSTLALRPETQKQVKATTTTIKTRVMTTIKTKVIMTTTKVMTMKAKVMTMKTTSMATSYKAERATWETN